LAWRLLRRCWDQRADTFAHRVGAIFAAQWFSTLFAYVFLHGDSENGLRTFTPIIGFMIASDIVIRRAGKAPPDAIERPVFKENVRATVRPTPALR
jgi:hypothetical protein